jgi:S1-C subfamily serine protease
MKRLVLPLLLLSVILASSYVIVSTVRDYRNQTVALRSDFTRVYCTAADAQDDARYAVANQTPTPDYDKLQSISVRVEVGTASGSGVLVTRQVDNVTRTYVWTAGHVAAELQNDDGTFRDAVIYQEKRDHGKLVSSSRVNAKVIAYSEPDDEDLAVLEVLKDNFQPITVSAAFAGDTVQGVGTELVHVGSTLGVYNSVSLGIISQTDRDLGGKMFDQTSCMGYPGSSGGGVYLRTGECIGLLTRGAGPGLNFIVPMRRIRAWAKQAGVEWTLDSSHLTLVRAPTALENAHKKATYKKIPTRAVIQLPRKAPIFPYVS